MVENVLDLLNKENSLLLQQGLHPRTKSLRALGGAAQRVLSWENTDGCRPATIQAMMSTRSIKMAKRGQQRALGFAGNNGRTVHCKESLQGHYWLCLFFFP